MLAEACAVKRFCDTVDTMSEQQLCTRCKKNPRPNNGSDPRRRWCNSCHAAYVKEWRAGRTVTDEGRRRDICRSYANVYKRRGKLVPPGACEWCHEPGELQMHHPDFDRPLLVIWLHPACRREVEAKGAVLDQGPALIREVAASTRSPRRKRSEILAAKRAKEGQ